MSTSVTKEILGKSKDFSYLFADQKISSYVARLKAGAPVSGSAKEINDAIWGTIRLQPIEACILDSPLLQRLRFIRQLGVVHWIYPGAIHTRFEHTLGVVYQTQQLISAINNASPTDYAAPITAPNASILRLSALLHDVGHSVFSHVSEHSLIKSDSLRAALNAFARENRLDKVQLSELIAFHIIGSPIFAQLLEVSIDRVGHEPFGRAGPYRNTNEIITRIQNAIIGKAIDDQVPLMHEIISGPLDADKLDYFVRDAKLSGIPSVLDISRLTQKITVKVLDQRSLPQPISSTVSGGLPHYFLFGLKWSGAAVLDELHLARILLYSKIYRHQKVLATEAMVEALFDALGRLTDGANLNLLEFAYRYTDDQLLWASADDIVDRVGPDADPELKTATKIFVADILTRLRERMLYVAALAVRPTYPGDPWSTNEEQTKGLRTLVEELANPTSAREFRRRLVGEVAAIAGLLPEMLPPGIALSQVPFHVITSAKGRLSGGTEIDRAFVFQGSGRPVTYRDLSNVNRPAWADAYNFSSASALILSPREIANLVFLAAEKSIRVDYKIALPTSALELSKQNEGEIAGLKKLLEDRGYYDGAPYDLRSRPNRLQKADISSVLDELRAKLEAIDEPLEFDEGRRPKRLDERIMYWLSQFRTEDHINCAIEVLRAIRVLSRDDTRSALHQFSERFPEFKGATIVLLGGLKDSSAVQGYFSRDLQETFPVLTTVEDAASKRIDAPIIFLDDFVGSGGQVQDVLGNWFDVQELKREDLNEQRELFGDVEREYLKSRLVGFVFVAGWEDGVHAAEHACDTIGLKHRVYAHIRDEEIPFAERILKDKFSPEIVESFLLKCQEIGAAILQADGKTAEVAERRALGYGNRGMLLISRYNVPTQVLTCIWRGGDIGKFEWQPLLRRRQKL